MSDNKTQFGVRLEGEELKNFKQKRGQKGEVFNKQKFSEKKTILETPKPPKNILYAWIAWVISESFFISFLIYTYIIKFSEKEKAILIEEAQKQNIPYAQLDDLLKIIQPIFLSTSLAFSILFLFFGFKMYKGKNWARIVLTFICVYQILGITSNIAYIVNGDMTALPNLIVGLLAIAILCWIWSKSAHAYIEESEYYSEKREK